jgi:4-hydroxy-2-oxoheptanedioate aldolase
LIVGRKHVEFRFVPQAREGRTIENSLKRKLADDALTFCLGVNQARTPNVSMIAAAAELDAIYVDLEHKPTSLENCSMLCVAAIGAGITPIVRRGAGYLTAK